ncbi:MAG: FGGY-family carbohydrate kinase [Gammaproteobacteria bacterium]|nr:FGGY-family carbohydrate kinase [Gammaproteobacteria bacterium]
MPGEATPATPSDPIYLGIDLGTSGCRIAAIDGREKLLATADTAIPTPQRQGRKISQDPMLWWQAVQTCLNAICRDIDPGRVAALAVDGTSATLLLCDQNGVPLTEALMYNDSRAQAQAQRVAEAAPPDAGCFGASSSLSKLLWFQDQGLPNSTRHALHQSDWIAGKLGGQWGHSDYNNCLKLGYDVHALAWPGWLKKLKVPETLLPTVHAPGNTVGHITEAVSSRWGFPRETRVVAGTSDGVAAFLAAGVSEPGQGVTSLGSTLVIKLLSHVPVSSPAHGIYSHRLGNQWLAGGASNSGGAVLLQHFTTEQLQAMTPQLDPEHLLNLNYYPLPGTGERFPVNDPNRTAQLEPRPNNDVQFFQAMLEGMGHIEARGYQLLHELGAPKVKEIKTTGGGSHNPAWTKIRECIIGVPITPPASAMAAYGAALLASGVVQRAFGG